MTAPDNTAPEYEARWWWEARLLVTSEDLERIKKDIAFKMAWEEEKQRQNEEFEIMKRVSLF